MLMDFMVTRVHLTSISRSCTAYSVSIRASIERHPCTVSMRQYTVPNFNLIFGWMSLSWLNVLFESTPLISYVDAQPNSSMSEALPPS